jgi:hypothetical protein
MSSFVDVFQTQCDIIFRMSSFNFLHRGCVFDLEPSVSGVETFREVVLGSFFKVESSRWNHNFFLNFVLFNDGSGAFLSVVEVFDSSLEVIVSVGRNGSK